MKNGGMGGGVARRRKDNKVQILKEKRERRDDHITADETLRSQLIQGSRRVLLQNLFDFWILDSLENYVVSDVF